MAKDESLSILLEDCKFINRFYIDTSYPVHWPTNYSKEDAFSAKDASNNIRNTIEKALRRFFNNHDYSKEKQLT